VEQGNLKLRETIKNNILILREKVCDTASKYKRDPSDITIIGVTKKFPAEYARIAFECGLKDLGENRVEELIEKREEFVSEGIFPDWHMIGTLQTKKAKKIIGNACLIHSVDSYKLAEEISRVSIKQNLVTPVLLQVNVSGETSKQGFSCEEILNDFDRISKVNGILVKGLMTMAPFTDDEYILEKVFFEANGLFCSIKEKYKNSDFNILSMGMSNDYHIAIRHGATHIRVGTAIFGQRS